MTWLISNRKLVIGCALLGVSFITGWNLGANRVQAKWDREQAAEMKMLNDGLVANEQVKFNAQVKEQQSNDAINYILDHPPVSRVLLPKTTCPATVDTASGSELPIPEADSATGTAGRETGQAQTAMDEAIVGMRSDAAEWGRALAACMVIRDWATSSP